MYYIVQCIYISNILNVYTIISHYHRLTWTIGKNGSLFQTGSTFSVPVSIFLNSNNLLFLYYQIKDMNKPYVFTLKRSIWIQKMQLITGIEVSLIFVWRITGTLSKMRARRLKLIGIISRYSKSLWLLQLVSFLVLGKNSQFDQGLR